VSKKKNRFKRAQSWHTMVADLMWNRGENIWRRDAYLH
jgi:hypothetical protein